MDKPKNSGDLLVTKEVSDGFQHKTTTIQVPVTDLDNHISQTFHSDTLFRTGKVRWGSSHGERYDFTTIRMLWSPDIDVKIATALEGTKQEYTVFPILARPNKSDLFLSLNTKECAVEIESHLKTLIFRATKIEMESGDYDSWNVEGWVWSKDLNTLLKAEGEPVKMTGYIRTHEKASLFRGEGKNWGFLRMVK